jgi:hypothetical protein
MVSKGKKMLQQAACLEGEGHGQMGIALQARSTNAPREVELNCLRVLNLTRQVKRHVGHANDTLQL